MLTPAASAAIEVSTVTTGLAVPWGLGFLPDGSALVTGRDDATISTIPPGRSADAPSSGLGTVDGVTAER